MIIMALMLVVAGLSLTVTSGQHAQREG